MKTIVSIIRFIFTTVIVLLCTVVWWGMYKDGSIGFNVKTPEREDRPSMQEVTLLLDKVTQGLPAAERESETSKRVVRAADKVYRNPTQAMIGQLIQNIDNQNVWKEVHFEDYIEYEYCYDQYHLIINRQTNDYTAIGKGISDLLAVSVNWTVSSPCREVYMDRLN